MLYEDKRLLNSKECLMYIVVFLDSEDNRYEERFFFFILRYINGIIILEKDD